MNLELMVPFYKLDGARRLPALYDDDFGWPAVDIHELKDKYIVQADVPGVDKKDIKIEFADGALTIEGFRQDDAESDDRRVHLKERVHCRFRRSFELGNDVRADKIHATYENGTLTIELPKAERAVPRLIPIAVR